MTRTFLVLALALAAAGCSKYWGSSTTDRPALVRPVIGADGAFWDAAAAAQRNDAEAFRFLLSPRFIHEAVLPRERRDNPETVPDFDAERTRLDIALKPYEATVQRMIAGHMQVVAELTANRLVEVGQPDYDIKFKDNDDRAAGPNRATVKVVTWTKDAQGPGEKPETLTVQFVQDRQRWLIDNVEPNRLKGAFAR